MNNLLKRRIDQLGDIGGQAYGAMKNQPNLSGLVGKTGLKIGGKGFTFGPDQAKELIGILGPVVEMLQKRRRR